MGCHCLLRKVYLPSTFYNRLNGHEFEQTPGDNEGHGSLACCSPWGGKELDTTEKLNSNLLLHVDHSVGRLYLWSSSLFSLNFQPQRLFSWNISRHRKERLLLPCGWKPNVAASGLRATPRTEVWSWDSLVTAEKIDRNADHQSDSCKKGG